VFVIFWRKEISAKASRKMLAKLHTSQLMVSRSWWVLQLKDSLRCQFQQRFRAAFTLIGPKSAKWHCWLDCLFLRIRDLHAYKLYVERWWNWAKIYFTLISDLTTCHASHYKEASWIQTSWIQTSWIQPYWNQISSSTISWNNETCSPT